MTFNRWIVLAMWLGIIVADIQASQDRLDQVVWLGRAVVKDTFAYAMGAFAMWSATTGATDAE